MPEDRLVGAAKQIIARFLPRSLEVERGAALLYQVKVDNRLEVTVNPRAPTRGQSAFQTDLCVFEQVSANVRIPHVVLEFKPGLSTHVIAPASRIGQGVFSDALRLDGPGGNKRGIGGAGQVLRARARFMACRHV